MRLPSAQAQSNPPLNFDPTAPTPAPTPTTSNNQDFFCGQGWEFNGFPYDLFAWEEIPWGMPGDEFLRRYKQRVEECSSTVFSGERGINATHSFENKSQKDHTTVYFRFHGENNTLSEIYLNRVPSYMRDYLLQHYGVPAQANYTPVKVRVGCVREGIVCPPVFEYRGEELWSGIWRLSETFIQLGTPNSITIKPVDSDLQSRPVCDEFLIFKFC
ncbi:MAG: hypothetical protein ACFB4I_13020 [Cyanophyceae cyanobacterium]